MAFRQFLRDAYNVWNALSSLEIIFALVIF